MRRRAFLRDVGALAVAGLAGCVGGPSAEPATDSPTAMPTERPSPTPRPTPTATASPTPTAEPTPTAPPMATSTPGGGDDAPTATASPTPTPSPTPTGPVQEVVVGPDGRLRFSPETFEVAAGTTVRWVWEAGGHNVKPSSTPSRSGWSGTPGGEFETFPGGHTYEHTFDVAGQYEYYCAPHRSAGMIGSFTVG